MTMHNPLLPITMQGIRIAVNSLVQLRFCRSSGNAQKGWQQKLQAAQT